jgi:hypothetical protein
VEFASCVKICDAAEGSPQRLSVILLSAWACGWLSSQFPGGLHEHDEVLVVVNGGADSGVVLVPLRSLNFAVTVLVTEGGEELKEDLVLGSLSGEHLGVEGAVVHTLKVSGVDGTGAVGVELEEGLVNHGLSLGVEGSLKFAQSVVVIIGHLL